MDSQHWYRKDGSPFHEVESKNGAMRPVTLRDARKIGARPSVTSVLNIVAKFNLVQWQVKQGILAALTLPRIAAETDDEFIARVIDDSKEQVKKAAEKGQWIHAAIDGSFSGEMYSPEYEPHAKAVRELISELFPTVSDWCSEVSFSHPRGFGGRVDLHSKATGITIDYKSKDGDFKDGKRLAYDQNQQLAGYREGLHLNRDAEGATIFVSRTHPGAIAYKIWSPAEMSDGWKIFEAALELWKRIKHYDPADTEVTR